LYNQKLIILMPMPQAEKCLLQSLLMDKNYSLCKIYTPNDQVNQLPIHARAQQYCIIDKSELTSLIVGGDWNCTLSKKIRSEVQTI